MKIHIHLFAHLKRYAPGDSGKFSLVLTPGATAADIVDRLGIPAGVERVILINGRPVDDSAVVSDGDRVTFLVPVTGG